MAGKAFDHAVARVRANAYERMADAVGPTVGAISEAHDAARGAARMYHATNEIKADRRTRDRDIRRGGQPVSSGEWFHGPEERKRALASLATDYAAFRNDLAITARGPNDGRPGSDGRSGSDGAWLHAVVDPVLAEWERFLAHVNANDLSILTLEWNALEEWHERLARLRELARTRGIALASPDPVRLPKTIWERGGSGSGSAADTAVSFLKVGVLAVIAATGFVGFFSVIRTWRDRRAAAALPPAPTSTPVTSASPAAAPTIAEARAHLAMLAAERGFSSIEAFEDSVVQIAADMMHEHPDAHVELAPDLEHLHARAVTRASRMRE